jgi:DNA-3-methyladenine glycosylase II
MSAKALKHLKSVDKPLGKLIQQVGRCKLRPPRRVEPFAALAESVAYQQLAGAAASTIWARVLSLYGGEFPGPSVVAKTDLRKLRRCGLSRAKCVAIKDLARKTLRGIVPTRKEAERLSDQELIDRCTKVRGIGPWTVEMLLIFSLGREDVLPTADYGVRNGYAITYGLRELPTPKELLHLGLRWAPYRTFAAWYLWRAVDSAVKKRRMTARS